MEVSKLIIPSNGQQVTVNIKDAAAREAIANLDGISPLDVEDKDATLSWGTKTKIATIGEQSIHVTLPGNPDTNVVTSVSGKTGDITLDKSDVGLGNVTNDAQVKRTEMGAASGVATLGTDGKVPSSQLPSYVDDVLEYDNRDSFPETGESGKIYVNKSKNTSWRWSGSTYTQIKGDLAIGTTTGTAADGGIANTHYNNTNNPHGVTKAQVGLDNVVNTGDSATPTEGGTTKFTTGGAYTELNKKVDKVSGKGLSTNDYTADDKKKVDNVMALENSATTTGSLALTPNILYSLGALTGALTVTLGSVVSGIPNTYMMEFDINDDAATPTKVPSFPASIVWREEPVWTTGKHYEISIRYSANTQAYYAMFVEFDTTS